ncbi:MAG: class I SAM-dependent methyltransferase [Nitrospirae bacterium]|nr:class I SAM-dependent methyltransferase [Nitrospirota bacterium]
MTDSKHEQATKDYFGRSAVEKGGYYDASPDGPRKHSKWQRRIRQIAVRLLDGVVANLGASAESLIDVGCGIGDFAIENAKRYPNLKKVSGSDFSPETIAIARGNAANLSNVSFHEADILAMPFNDKEYDITLCINMLHHIRPAELGQALSELARITRHSLLVEIKNSGNFYYSSPKKHPGGITVYPTDVKTVSRNLGDAGFVLRRKRGIMLFDRLSPMIVLRYDRIGSSR